MSRSVANLLRALTRSVGVGPLAIVAAILLLTFGATAASAAPADFSWSSSASTTQAAARTGLTLNYASSSAQTLNRLDVDLPAGMMNNPASAFACPSATFLTDQCPATSTVGSVTSQVVLAGRVTVSVPGTIYRVGDPSSTAAAVYGIVLRPPLSNLGITSKRYLTDSISFLPTGALRHSINAGAVAGIAGGAIAARISQLSIQFLATQSSSGGPLLTNPTTCATRQFTATGTFSDGSAATKTATLTTTGCPAVPFDASFGVNFTKSEPNQRTSFAILLGQAGGAGSNLHTAHINSASVDLSKVGALDATAFDALPGCTDAQAASAAGCPANSRIGDITANVEGFGTVSGGGLYRSYTAGRFAIGERSGFKPTHVTFGGGTAATASTVNITGLPELPYVSLQLAINKDLLVLNGSCTTPSVAATITPVSPTGVHHEVSHTVQTRPPDCSPVVKLLAPGDADADNDGYADQPFRSPDFSVPFSATDDAPIDAAKVACTLTDPTDPTKVKGMIKMIKDNETGYTCQIASALGGNDLLTIQVTDRTGHVTVVRRTFTVDAAPPTIAIDEPGVQFTATGAIDAPITITDDSLVNPNGVVDTSCERKGWDGTIKGSAKVITDRDTGRSKGFCSFAGVSDGSYEVSVRAVDYVGHVTIVKFTWVVDTMPPTIAIDEQGVHITASPNFDVFTMLHVIEANPGTSTCSTGDLDGDGTPDYAPCGPGQPVQMKKGLNAVNVKLADRAGNTSTAVVKVFLDTDPPAIAIDEQGVHLSGTPSIDVPFTVTDDSFAIPEGTVSASCERKGWDGTIKGNAKLTKADAGRALDSCTFDNVSDGTYEISITAVDYVGHVTIVKFTWTVDTTPPTVTLTNPGDNDTDGDGFADQRYRPAAFDVPVDISDAGSGVDPTKSSCSLTDPQDAARSKGTVKFFNQTKGFRCSVSGAEEGDAVLTITAVDYVGTVTIVKRMLTIDTTAPKGGMSGANTNPLYESSGSFSIPFAFDTDSPTTYACNLRGAIGVAKWKNIVLKRSPGHDDGECDFSDVPEGQFTAEVVATDAAGNTGSDAITVIVDTTAPTITLPDPADADSDGDGVIDQPFRSASPEFTFDVADSGSGFDPNSADCSATPRKGGMVKGNITINSANRVKCQFPTLPGGDADLQLSAADRTGHVTVVKRTFTVDAAPPEISALEAGNDGWAACRYATDPYVEDSMRVGFSIDDSTTGSGVSGAQVSFNRGPRQTISLDGTRTAQTADIAIDCREMTTGLDVEYSVFGQDAVGNESQASSTVKIDASPPVITNTDPRDNDSDGDGFADSPQRAASFDVPVSVTDDGSGVDWSSAECKAKPKGGTATTSPPKGINSPNLLCSFSNLPNGDVDVEISVADFSGLVTTFTRSFTVDASPPVVTIAAPSNGQVFAFGSAMPVAFAVGGSGPFTTTCVIDNTIVRTPCASGSALSLSGIAPGLHALSVRATDPSNLSGAASRTITIAAPQGGQDCVAIYPPPPGCP